ncbi:hypothetical protein FRB91_003338 [Serendipita sp. 411]|nr:hypothetical protein FRB91_003338 [Serendipita sp. 411]
MVVVVEVDSGELLDPGWVCPIPIPFCDATRRLLMYGPRGLSSQLVARPTRAHTKSGYRYTDGLLASVGPSVRSAMMDDASLNPPLLSWGTVDPTILFFLLTAGRTVASFARMGSMDREWQSGGRV